MAIKKTLLFSLLLQFCIINAQKFDSQKLDDYFKVLADNHKVMGSFALLKDGNIIYKKSIGFADVENNIKANENTQYRIGSISKTFTAVLVMKAVEKNLLKLDDKLNKYYPEIKNSEKITIENLLNHRSGIHNFTEDPNYLKIQTQPISEMGIVKIIADGGSDFEPGIKYEYSNSNYVLLAIILEKIEKESYSDLLNEQIVKPIGLKFTSVGGKIDASKNQAYGYFYTESKYQKSNEIDLVSSIGAGDIISTPLDLIKFITALGNGKLVSKVSLSQMKNFKGYGFGLQAINFNNEISFGHSGRIDAFISSIDYFPKSKVSFAMTTNQLNFDFSKISTAALNAVNGFKVMMPNFKPIKLKVNELMKFVGVYSSENVSLKIKIFIKDDQLYARATGQDALPLEAISNTTFQNKEDEIEMEFNNKNGTIDFLQLGAVVTFKREK